MQIKSNLWFENDRQGYFGKGRIELLEQIERLGSISAAAKAMKTNYKAAWDAVNEMNNLSDAPIVERETGGKGGGGTVLTEQGRGAIALFHELEALQQHFWASVETVGSDPKRLKQFAKRLTLHTSARNQLLAQVEKAEASGLGAEVFLRLSGGEAVRVNITRRSLETMQIRPGMELFIILKSSWVRLCAGEEAPRGNRLPCRLEKVERDGADIEVTAALSGTNTLTIALSPEAFESLGLNEGDRAIACFEPSDALLAV